MTKTGKGKNSGIEAGAEPVSLLGKTFIRCQSSLRRYLSRFLRNKHDIEDVLNEAFLRSFEMEKTNPINAPTTYLYRTARNLAIKHNSRSAYKLTDYIEDLELTEVYGSNLSQEDVAQSEEKFRFFCKAVEKLPLQCRKAFILRKVYGFSHREIAAQMQISTSTVEKFITTGMVRCTEYMRNKGYFDDIKTKQKRQSG